jgi:hypothetical protein
MLEKRIPDIVAPFITPYSVDIHFNHSFGIADNGKVLVEMEGDLWELCCLKEFVQLRQLVFMFLVHRAKVSTKCLLRNLPLVW